MSLVKGKIILITGAAGLIGRHFSCILSEAGAKVIGVDIRMAKNLSDNKGEDIGENIGCVCDITSSESLNELKHWVSRKYGFIDCIINSAAIDDKVENASVSELDGKFEVFPLNDWQKSINVGLTGTFLVSQIFLPIINPTNGGSIINICSTYGMVGPRQDIYIDNSGSRLKFKNPAYPAVKGAVLNFTRYLAAYLGARNIRVNCISPGGVENGQSEWFIRNYSSNTPLGRMAKLDDFNGIVMYLCSDDSRYSTGANYVVDGGYTAI